MWKALLFIKYTYLFKYIIYITVKLHIGTCIFIDINTLNCKIHNVIR